MGDPPERAGTGTDAPWEIKANDYLLLLFLGAGTGKPLTGWSKDEGIVRFSAVAIRYLFATSESRAKGLCLSPRRMWALYNKGTV